MSSLVSIVQADSQTTLAVNRASFNSILSSQVDSAVSGFSNDFENEHQSIFIHYGLKIDCLVNQLQCIATALHPSVERGRLVLAVKL